MTVLVFESNLLWSSKLKAGLVSLGHLPLVVPGGYSGDVLGEVAIVNLSQPKPDPAGLIRDLQAAKVFVIAHAGHKEKDLLEVGRRSGADLLVTNGELSAKLGQVLERAGAGRERFGEADLGG